MSDSEFSTTKILKPFPAFEAVYQGQTHTIPIAFPGTLDPLAGQTGYSSTLLGALPVPLGAQLQIWIPACFTADGGTQVIYRYEFVFRLRSLRDFRNPAPGSPRPPWHIPQQQPGVADTTPATGGPRFVIPGSVAGIQFPADEVGGFSPAIINVRDAQYAPIASGVVAPRTPTGVDGTIQQGVLDPVVAPGAAGDPIFTPYQLTAQGDELMILAYPPSNVGNWDFATGGPDEAFSFIYGTNGGARPEPIPATGIYVHTGTNPSAIASATGSPAAPP
jgi:hypothetical protein